MYNILLFRKKNIISGWIVFSYCEALIRFYTTTVVLYHFPTTFCATKVYFCLPGVTERTTTGFSLPATKPKPSTGSLLISTRRGAGGRTWTPSTRISSREPLWDAWLPKERQIGLYSILQVRLSIQHTHKHTWTFATTSVTLSSLRDLNMLTKLFKREVNRM